MKRSPYENINPTKTDDSQNIIDWILDLIV
jgi:hypothetical protein